MRITSTLFAIFLFIASCTCQLESCDNSFLGDVFSAAVNYQCIVARITSTDARYHTTTYTEGSLYYNRYTDSLNNIASPNNKFPSVESGDKTCINGIEQPFAAPNIEYKATYPFDIGVSRTGVVTFQSNNVVQNQFNTYCYHNYSLGIDANGVLYVVELRAIPIEQPCPSSFGIPCQGVGSTNSCLSTQIYTGGQCYYRSCSDLDCGGNVCINNGGIARCIDTTPGKRTPMKF